ncbi:MAG: flagellar hook-length control protein FliK [Schwartzia sp.]|nr:flagellar hook-length control protein FliK [Schwartzia sp. (in: firmicutes)]
MKAENLMMQPAQSAKAAKPAGKAPSIRAAANSQMAAKGAQAADKNDFGSALDNAKTAQQDARAEVKDAKQPEQPKDARQPEAKSAPDAKAEDAKTAESTKTPEEAAAEAASDLPKSNKKEKSAKSGASEGAKDAENTSEAEGAATTLNAMLMAMAGSAQATSETQPIVTAETTADAQAMSMDVPELVAEEPTHDFVPGALDALLPQDAAKEQQAAQNQQLMDMLSGNGTEMRLTSEQLAGLSSNPQESMALAQEAAQPVMNTEQLASEVQAAEPSLKTGEAMLERPEAAAVLQDAVQASASAQNPRDVRTTQAERSDGAKGLFAGVPLTVEDVVLDKAQDRSRQNLGDMLNRQFQGQGQANEAMAEKTRVSSGEALDAARGAEQGARQTGAQQSQTPISGAGAIPQGMTFAETMNVAAPTEAAPAQQVQDPYNVMQQVVEQARLIRSDANTEMVIRLNPEHLGELTLRVAVTASGAVNATFHTENAQVRALLESSMIQLKQELQQQGLKVNNVDVQSGLSQDFFAQSQAGQQGYPQPQHSARNQAADRAAFENDADALTVGGVEASTETNPAANVGASDGVNYLV